MNFRKNSELQTELFDGTYDSQWWRSKWGKPPLFVIIGIWLLDGPAALAVGGIPGFLVAAVLFFIASSVGLIDRYETRITPTIGFVVLVGTVIALAVAWRFLRNAIRTTRLLFMLQNHSKTEFEHALKRYEREAARNKSQKSV